MASQFLCDPDPIFYDSISEEIVRLPCPLGARSFSPNLEAVTSVLQFGAMIPPLSPWIGLDRQIPGNRDRASIADSNIDNRIRVSDDINQQAQLLESTVDAILANKLESGKRPVVLFSGGVDSGFLASRLAALGRDDALLINYAFSKNDPESLLAEAMAKSLGLTFKRVFHRSSDLGCLKNPGQIWPQPFGDHSVVPTSNVAAAVIAEIDDSNAFILDGTGADGGFGLLKKIRMWNQVNRIPETLKIGGSATYRLFNLATSTSPIERYAKSLRRARQMPPMAALMAQNPLSGMYYTNAYNDSLINRLTSWINGAVPDENAEAKIIAADLALTCTNVFAQKAHPIFKSAGFEVVYPFLDEIVVRISLKSSKIWRYHEESKAQIKYSLAKHVPSNFVYRRKSGFTAPQESIFFSSDFISYFREINSHDSVLKNIIDERYFRKILDHLGKKKTLPEQTLNFIWSAVFIDRWYRTSMCDFLSS